MLWKGFQRPKRLEFERETKAGGAKLIWMLKPSQLRELGNR